MNISVKGKSSKAGITSGWAGAGLTGLIAFAGVIASWTNLNNKVQLIEKDVGSLRTQNDELRMDLEDAIDEIESSIVKNQVHALELNETCEFTAGDIVYRVRFVRFVEMGGDIIAKFTLASDTLAMEEMDFRSGESSLRDNSRVKFTAFHEETMDVRKSVLLIMERGSAS